MGWCDGSYIADELWDEIREYLPEEKRKLLANKIYDLFCNQDADCWENSMNIIKDADILFEQW
jgi:hypothetical protein